jgi:hypothetical protein
MTSMPETRSDTAVDPAQEVPGRRDPETADPPARSAPAAPGAPGRPTVGQLRSPTPSPMVATPRTRVSVRAPESDP